MNKIARNAPCPCGSGRKYKGCCEVSDRARSAERRGQQRQRDELLDLERETCAAILRWNADVGGDDPLEECPVDPEERQMSVPWAAYDTGLIPHFCAANVVSARRRAWLGAQEVAEVGIWAVEAVEPGQSITLCSRLTGSERRVIELSGSRMLVRHDHIVARVVMFEGAAYLCGCLGQKLAPRVAEFAVETTRDALHALCRLPKRRLLRPDEIGDPDVRHAILMTAAMCARLAAEERPVLQNTDGEVMVLVEDRFRVAPGARAAVQRAIGDLDRVAVVDESPGRTAWQATKAGNAKIKEWDNTIIGRIELRGATLTLSTNSITRADRLRERVLAVCPPMEFVERRESEPKVPQDGALPAAREERPPPPEVQAAVRQRMASYYTGWWDKPIPVLGNRTPRQAQKSTSGKREVDLLLREMEWHEARKPAWQRVDIAELRGRG